MDCSSGTALFVVVAGALILALSAFLRSKEAKKAADALRTEVERLRLLVTRLETRVHALESPTIEEEAVSAPAVPEPAIRASIPAPVPASISVPAQAPPAQPPPMPPPMPVRPAVPPAPRQSLEEKLGARLPVWIGSIALALAGTFLVKLSFERGWLSPALRVAMGVLFGVGLLAAGEVTRRNRSTGGISQGLSAAGIADLFACFLAGVALYKIIPPPLAFGLMVLTAAVAVALSLRQGKMVALVGLIGGFLTPYLVRTGNPNVRGLFAYLLLLQIGLLLVAWKRGWTEIAGLALGGGLLWTFVWMAGPFTPGDAVWLCLFLLLSVASVVVAGLQKQTQDAGNGGSGGKPGLFSLTWAAVPGAILAMAVLTQRTSFSTEEWVFFGILAAGVLVLARLKPELHPLAWVAAGAAAALLAAWAVEVKEPELGRFLATVAGLGALLAVGAYAALWGSGRPGRWASLSVVSGLVFFLIAWGTASPLRPGLPWGPIALALAAVYLAALVPVVRLRRSHPEMDPGLAALAVAVTTFVSLAVPLELERQWLTVAWALEVTALVWLAGRFKLPALAALARLMAVLVTVRLLVNFSVLEYPIGTNPIFNWLLYGYGLPLLAFAAAAWLARRQGLGQAQFATLLEGGALAFAFALVTLETRQLYH